MRWWDVIIRDLKKYNLGPGWRDATCERTVWRMFVEDGAAELNCFLEEDEEKKR